MPRSKTVQISFVIPAKNEEKSIVSLYQEILGVVKKLRKSFEIIFVDDGSQDRTFEKIRELHQKDSRVRGVRLRGWFGKSTALQTGFDRACGKIIITLDADLQDHPREIPRFLKKLDAGYDLVCGWKKIRHDPLSKTFPSKILNYIVSELTGVRLHDINCGFKAYKQDVAKSLNLYGELYRFIPVFAAKQNFKVTEIPIAHRARKYGRSKYGLERNFKGFLDLITTVFLTGYLKRPGHFFGGLGLISFFLGFLIGLYITYLRITTGTIQYRHPLLFLGMLLMIIGVQLISTGLLAEMITHWQQEKRTEKVIRESL